MTTEVKARLFVLRDDLTKIRNELLEFQETAEATSEKLDPGTPEGAKAEEEVGWFQRIDDHLYDALSNFVMERLP